MPGLGQRLTWLSNRSPNTVVKSIESEKLRRNKTRIQGHWSGNWCVTNADLNVRVSPVWQMTGFTLKLNLKPPNNTGAEEFANVSVRSNDHLRLLLCDWSCYVYVASMCWPTFANTCRFVATRTVVQCMSSNWYNTKWHQCLFIRVVYRSWGKTDSILHVHDPLSTMLWTQIQTYDRTSGNDSQLPLIDCNAFSNGKMQLWPWHFKCS